MVCVKRSVRLSSKGIDRWRGSFFERGAERSVETLREMRNRSCACGRPASPLPSRLLCSPLLFAISLSLSLSPSSVSTGLPLQHLLPVSRSARFAYLPETRRRYSSHVLDPRRRRFTVSNKPSSSSSFSSFSFFLLLSFLLSILASFFPSSGISFARGQMLCTREQGISRFPNYPVLGLKKRKKKISLLENSEGRSCWLHWCRSSIVYLYLCFSRWKKEQVVMLVSFRNDWFIVLINE